MCMSTESLVVYILYREIKGRINLNENGIGDEVLWRQLSICSSDLSSQEEFVGSSRDRVLIHVSCQRARVTKEYSRFVVVDLVASGNGRIIIQMKAMTSLDYIIDFEQENYSKVILKSILLKFLHKTSVVPSCSEYDSLYSFCCFSFLGRAT